MWLPVSLSSDLVTGTYRFTFTNVANIDSIPLVTAGASYKIGGKLVTFNRSYADKPSGKYIVELTLKENPEPIMTITVGILLILGLTIGYMSLSKVEKLVESPSVNAGIFVVAGFGALALWRSFKKGAA